MFSDESLRSLYSKMGGLSKYTETLYAKIKPTISAMFRAIFGHARGRIRKNTQHEICGVMFRLQLLFCTISMFMYQFWRYLSLNLRVQKENREEYAE